MKTKSPQRVWSGVLAFLFGLGLTLAQAGTYNFDTTPKKDSSGYIVVNDGDIVHFKVDPKPTNGTVDSTEWKFANGSPDESDSSEAYVTYSNLTPGVESAVTCQSPAPETIPAPASYSVNVEIVGDTKLTVSHPTDQSGTIKFDLVGKTKSDQATDAILKAQLKTGKTELAKVGLSVVVPGKIGTPHPNFNGAVSGVNRVLDATTIPAATNLPTGYVFLATTYGTILSVQVTDQFDHNLDKIYDVSIVPPGTLQIFW